MVHTEDYNKVKSSLIRAESLGISENLESRPRYFCPNCITCAYINNLNGKCLNRMKREFEDGECDHWELTGNLKSSKNESRS
jgi:hypothetical protein